MSWLSKTLSVALLEYYAFLKLDAFYEEFMFFSIFLLLNQQWGEFLCIIGLRNCVREHNSCHSPRSFDMRLRNLSFLHGWCVEVEVKLNMHVHGVRTVPVGFKISSEEKMREWGRKSFAFLQDIPKYLSGSLVDTMTISWSAFQMNSTIGMLSSFQDTKHLEIPRWLPHTFAHDLNCLPQEQHVETKHDEEI